MCRFPLSSRVFLSSKPSTVVFDALMVKQQQTFVASEATSPDREAEESK
jgi:hypothetical protein